MNDNNNIKLSRPVPPFLRYCSAIIPTAFDDSLSYYEALCALYKWLQTNVIDTINHNASVTNDFINKEKELEELFKQLKEYVDTYFDNLDVQEEINNKLDEMAEDGTLAEIIANFVNGSIEIFAPNTEVAGDLSAIAFKKNNDRVNLIVDFATYTEESYLETKSKLIAKGFNKFDYAIISHYHVDHVGMLSYMLADNDFDFSECKFYLPKTPDYSRFIGSTRYVPEYESNIKEMLSGYGIQFITPSDNTVLDILDDFHIKFFNSDLTDFENYYNVTEIKEDEEVTNYNNFSMVNLIEFKESSILLTGDIESAGQATIASTLKTTPDVLKVEHHAISNIVNKDYRYSVANAKINYITGNFDKIVNYVKSEKGNLYATRYSGDISIRVTPSGIKASATNGAVNSTDTGLNLGIGGITIPANTDLDDLKEIGSYLSTTASNTATLTNCPVTNAFKLIVMTKNYENRLFQILLVPLPNIVYIRSFSIDTWSPWRIINSGGDCKDLTSGSDLDNMMCGCFQCAYNVSPSILHLPSELSGQRFKVTTEEFNNNASYVQTVESCIKDTANHEYSVTYYRIKPYYDQPWSEWIRISHIPIAIAENDDLNNYTQPYNYYAPNATIASSLSNTPAGMQSGSFNLEVKKLSFTYDRLIQKLTVIHAHLEIYYRVKTNTGWSNWFKANLTELS